MNNKEELIRLYKEKEENARIWYIQLKRKIRYVSIARIAVFLIGLTGVIFLFNYGWIYISTFILTVSIPFLGLVKYHTRLFTKKEYAKKEIEINKQELNALEFDYADFNSGKEFIDPRHLYTYDLDIFGDYSFFQYINRTCTGYGKRRLAKWLNQHLKNRNDIIHRQESIKELSKNLKVRQHFRITGLLCREQEPSEEELKNWLKTPGYFYKNSFYRIVPNLVTGINIALLTLAILNIIPYTLWGGFVIGVILFSGYISKKITFIQFSSSHYFSFLFVYAQLLKILEQMSPASKDLRGIQSKIENQDTKASYIIEKASKLLDSLDQRNNVLLALILNGLFLWEIRKMIQIEKWREEHAHKIPEWLDAIADFEALASLSTFAYNHPDHSYPTIEEKGFIFESSPMSHPLINPDRFTKNPISIPKRGFFLIITGANMAGKSTYLRTAGINYLMACIGLPVCSKSMRIYPAQLITSLRTTDSLKDNESYFFAELKRLKLIIDKLNYGEELFIILDEILKGTNSIDKQKGSFALIKQLLKLHSNGIIATHDLALGRLKESFPESIRNQCFEAEIRDDELTFSYQLKEGIAQNMNACFLMSKMGITDIDGE